MARKDKHVTGGAGKVPARKAVPPVAAKPLERIVAPNGNFVVRWTKFDYGGPWCLGVSTSEQIVKMMQRIASFESMTPMEVFKPGGPGVEYGNPAELPNQAARDRLEELRLADETRISRLRFGGPERLFGFRRDPEFYAVFWDPNHEIWPSHKKNT